MCGIGLTVTLCSNSSCWCIQNSNRSNIQDPNERKDTQEESNHCCLGTDHLEWIPIQQSLEKALSYRGPDVPQSRMHRQLVQTSRLSPLSTESNFASSSSSTTTTRIENGMEENERWQFNLFASVLHMRGDTITSQPFIWQDDDFDYIFAWNGELYSLFDSDPSDIHMLNSYDMASHSLGTEMDHSVSVSSFTRQSDTQLVLQFLLHTVFTKAQNKEEHTNHPHEYERAEQQRQQPLQLQLQLQHEELAHAMSQISGEYAFVLAVLPRLLSTSSSSSVHSFSISSFPQSKATIYFGRDPFGRRSLLIHAINTETNTTLVSPPTSSNPAVLSSLILSSVALTEYWLQGNQAVLQEGDSATNILPQPMQEVVAGQIFRFDFHSAQLTCLPIPQTLQSSTLHFQQMENPLPSAVPLSCTCTCTGTPMDSISTFHHGSTSMIRASHYLHYLLEQAVRRRVCHLPIPQETKVQTSERMTFLSSSSSSSLSSYCPTSSSVAILFSGGLDSVILAALCHNHIPIHQSIDLINVSFHSDSISSTSMTLIDASIPTNTQHHSHTKKKKTPKVKKDAKNLDMGNKDDDPLNSSQDPTTPNKMESTDPFASPDRQAAMASWQELCRLYPQRCWNFIAVNIPYSEILSHQTRIRTLILPLISTMDFNIGTAMWFASRGIGELMTSCPSEENLSTTSTNTRLVMNGTYPSSSEQGKNAYLTSNKIVSNARAVIVGIGADELMAGYTRHRTVYRRGGYNALQTELKMEQDRLWTRNLGRDDRIISDHGKEARFPYLDEDVVSFLKSLDVLDVCDMTLPPGEGDKMILRLIAQNLGLTACSGLVKRAIQFGSRISKITDVERFGSSRKCQGWKTFQ